MTVPAGGEYPLSRMIGPDEACRILYNRRTGLVKGQGYSIPLYADEALTIPADVRALDGSVIPESTLVGDAWSKIPLFLYPDDTDVVYTSVDGGPAMALYARTTDIVEHAIVKVDDDMTEINTRIDEVDAQVGAVVTEVAHKRDILPSVVYLDAYNSLFGGVPFVTGQRTTTTTLSEAADVGATSVTVASATAIVNGMLMVVNAGTPQQQLLTVTNVAGSTLTVSPALTTALPSGATIAPMWLNVSHITADSVGGSRAYGYWLANAKKPDGSYVFSGPAGQTIVWLGDSWTAESIIEFEAEIDARLGQTTVINAGIPGNRLSQMIARFATDVTPHNPDIVIVEYGVNDVYGLLTSNQMAAELQQVVMMCQAIGADVVLPGMVPLIDHPGASADRNAELKALVTSPEFPSVSVSALLPRMEILQSPRNATSIRLGTGTQTNTTGANNTAIGRNAQAALTSGNSNTAIGDQTQNKITTANYNTAIGQGVQFNATGGFNTGIGALSQFNLSSGIGNVAIGYGTQYSPNGATGNATTTASYQTVIGYQAGQGGTSQDDRITAIGMWALCQGAYSVSIGSQASTNGTGAIAIGGNTQATAAGAVAIGRDNGGVGASATTTNQFVLGTDKHIVTIPGTLKLPASTASKVSLNIAPGVAPTTPVDGDMWLTASGLFVRIGGVTRQVTVT